MNAQAIIPGIFAVPVLSVFLIFMPQSIFEFKNSSLLKRIGATPVKPYVFLLAISLYNLIIVLVSWVLTFLFAFAVFHDSLGLAKEIKIYSSDGVIIKKLIDPTFMAIISHGDWGGFFYSFIILSILTMSIGLFISSIAKSTLFIQSVGIGILLVALFVGPVCLPVAMVGKVNIIKYFGYLLPLKYSIATMQEALSGGIEQSLNNFYSTSIWEINSPYFVADIYESGFDYGKPLEIFSKSDKILNLVMPYFFIIIFMFLTLCTFTWSSRSETNLFQKLVNKQLFIKKVRSLQSKANFLNINFNLNSEYILEVNNISKTFNRGTKHEVKASQNINFKIKRGVNTAILGSNGAGKTVLTEMILGLNKPDSGHFVYNYKYNKSFQEKIGIQFQESSYPIGIKCKDIVRFIIEIYRLRYTKKELMELVERFGISEFYNKPAYSLSGGQQQRLNLLLSILNKPSILFLDELSTGLDIKIRNTIKSFIKEYALEHDITIVIISHDMNEVEYLCDDIIVIQKGVLVEHKSKEEILSENKNLEVYISKYL